MFLENKIPLKMDVSMGTSLWWLLVLFFRPRIMDEKDVNQNVLSARLYLKMKSDDALSLLRKEIGSGKLGKFKVAALPDVFDGVLPIY